MHVAAWATEEQVRQGVGVLYDEACRVGTEAEYFILRSTTTNLATAIIDHAPAVGPWAESIKTVLVAPLAPEADVCAAIVSIWQLATSRPLIASMEVQAATADLEGLARAIYREHKRQGFPWKPVLAIIAIGGVAYGVYKLAPSLRGPHAPSIATARRRPAA